jgi:DNA-binding NtrC family response regulator
MSGELSADHVETVKPEVEADADWALANQLELMAQEAGRMPTVLVVDDEPEIVEELADDLRLEGYQVETASDGQEALSRIAANPEIALLVADIRMPVMDGVALIKKLREDHADRPIQVIFLTGHAGLDEAVEAIRLEAFEFLTKPVSLSHLAHVVSLAREMLNLKLHEKNLRDFFLREIARLTHRVETLERENEVLRRAAKP